MLAEVLVRLNSALSPRTKPRGTRMTWTHRAHPRLVVKKSAIIY